MGSLMLAATSLMLAVGQSGPPRLATGNLSVDAIQHSPIGAEAQDDSFVPDIPTVEHLKALHEAGLWAYEDYIAWGMVEPAEGEWDWSHHEEVYRRVTEAGLVYIPYIWCHFPPTWLRNDDRTTLMKESAEGKECYIFSIYDPRTLKWYERFYEALHAQFGDRLQQVYACLLGPYGEGNYPLPDVSWVVELGECPRGRYWCADQYALPAFQQTVRTKYPRIELLNKAWATDFEDFDAITFPPVINQMVVPDFTDASPAERMRWLDFIHWYHQALIDFSSGSIEKVCEIFGPERVATKPGGNAGNMNPVSWGTYNPAYAKMAAQHGIAMQSADSHGAYWADKWTSTAYAFYGVPYRTEAAGGLDDNLFIARTFTDICCGASRLFTYQIEQHLPTAMKYLHLFTGGRSKTDVALLAPTTVYYLNGGIAEAVDNGMALRDYFDYDVLDELLVTDGALESYRVLIATGCRVIDPASLGKIKSWVEQGGVLLWSEPSGAETLDGNTISRLAEASPEGSPMGEGLVYSCGGDIQSVAASATPLVFSTTTSRYPEATEQLDGEADGVWVAERDNELLLLNKNSGGVKKAVKWRGQTHTVELAAYQMVVVFPESQ